MATVVCKPHEISKPHIVFRDGVWRMKVLNIYGGRAMMPPYLWSIYYKMWDAKKTIEHVKKLNRIEA